MRRQVRLQRARGKHIQQNDEGADPHRRRRGETTPLGAELRGTPCTEYQHVVEWHVSDEPHYACEGKGSGNAQALSVVTKGHKYAKGGEAQAHTAHVGAGFDSRLLR